MKREFQRSLGLELSGSKNDKTFLAILDHHPKSRRLILSDVERLNDPDVGRSNDELVIERITAVAKEAEGLNGLAVNGPTSLPPFFASISMGKTPKKDAQWIWLDKTHQSLGLKVKPFEPYLQRPIEVWLRYLCREKFQVSDALGANAAPLTARFQYLRPRLPEPIHEIFVRGTLSRIILSLGLKKQMLRDYTDLEKGVAAREAFLDELTKRLPQLFIYDKDLETLILHSPAFNSFFAALNLHLFQRGQCEKAPKSFPREATWTPLPLRNLNWDRIF